MQEVLIEFGPNSKRKFIVGALPYLGMFPSYNFYKQMFAGEVIVKKYDSTPV